MAIDIKVPVLGESVTEATVSQWLKKPGESVTADEPLVELETDKVTVEVPAPSAGVLEAISADEGAEVEVGALLGMINENGAAKPAAMPETPSPTPVPAAEPASTAAESTTSHTAKDPGPAVRKIAAEKGLDLSNMSGSGKDGRVTKAEALAASPAAPAAQAKAPAPAVSKGEREERVKMTRLRQRIAERLKEAQNTAAMLTTFNEVDMGAIMALRSAHKERFEKKHGVKLGFMSFFVKACVGALKEIPAVNAEIDGDEVVYKNYYDIGVAVSTPNGLMVPVVRDCDTKGFAEIEGDIMDFGQRARDGKIGLNELSGGTFTISNGGVFGSLMSTPILNPPQSGILGMHKTQMRPVAIDGKVEVRPMMYLALSYDHRIIDGREAVTFLVRVKEALEDPQRLLLDL